MAGASQNDIQQALATRINMQIMISSLPIIEESMDIDFSRWIDAVPLPPEVPDGTGIHIRVSLGTDLQRVRWGAYGAPSAFIPKMSEYLDKSGMSAHDLALINTLGDALKPDRVGSWIAVSGGRLTTGWQFCEPKPLAALAHFLADDASTGGLLAWAKGNCVETFSRFAQSIGDEAESELVLALPGDSSAAQVDVIVAAFRDLRDEQLPEHVKGALLHSDEPDLLLSLKLGGGALRSLSVILPSAPLEVVSKLASESGVPYESRLAQIIGMIQSSGPHRLEYRREGDATQIDVELIPHEVERTSPNFSKN